MAPEDALTYITAGRGRGTLVGKAHRYTYRFGKPEGKKGIVFVSVLAGPNNGEDYLYLGFLTLEGREKPDRIRPYWKLIGGKKGRPNASAFKAIDWYLKAVQLKPKVAGQAEFHHEGVCGVCGRPLTVPESIESGIGPICAEKLS